jgi:hypothetical protein
MEIIIGIIKGSIIAIALIYSLSRVWVMPESQRQRCVKAVHAWHIERIHKIDNLAVDGTIKSEMIEFSQIKETEQLEQVCGVKNAEELY